MTATSTPVITPANYSNRQIRTTHELLDMLDRCHDRNGTMYSGRRSHERRALRIIVSIRILPDAKLNGLTEPVQFECWGQNVSRGGISLVHHTAIPGKEVMVCLGSSSTGENMWLNGEIVRSREFTDGAFEVGVKFTGRSSTK